VVKPKAKDPAFIVRDEARVVGREDNDAGRDDAPRRRFRMPAGGVAEKPHRFFTARGLKPGAVFA
jgi:hypothetical protein